MTHRANAMTIGLFRRPQTTAQRKSHSLFGGTKTSPVQTKTTDPDVKYIRRWKQGSFVNVSISA